MQTPLQITMRDVQHSATLDEGISDKARKLEACYERIIGCHVTVERVQRHQRQGQLFNVHIRLGVPGSEIEVNRNQHENIHVALRDTFDVARRMLENYAHKQRAKDKGGHAPLIWESSELT